MSAERHLVTGASGFLGTALAGRWAAAGVEVHGVARRTPAAGTAGVRWHESDLAEPGAARRLVTAVRPRRIVHLASLVSGRRDLELVLPALAANLVATVELLVAAAEAGVERFVLAGSMEEPEAGEAPSSPYAAAKGAASSYARMFHALYGLPVVVARLFMVYGPGQRDLSKVVPASILAALGGRRPPISSGSRPVDWIYVDDAAAGLAAAATAPGVEGRTVDLGSGELTTVRAVVEKICALCGVDGPEVGALADRPLEGVRRADPEAAFAALGWRARTSLDEGLRRTVEALRAQAAGARGGVAAAAAPPAKKSRNSAP